MRKYSKVEQQEILREACAVAGLDAVETHKVLTANECGLLTFIGKCTYSVYNLEKQTKVEVVGEKMLHRIFGIGLRGRRPNSLNDDEFVVDDKYLVKRRRNW